MFTVVDLLENSAERFPKKAALKDRSTEISYSELLRNVQLLAKFLVRIGVQKSDRVGIFKDNSVNAVIAILAVMSAGAAFVCINTRLKPRQVNHVIDDCGIKIIISSHKKIETFVDNILIIDP